MHRNEHSVEIDAPVERVFEFVAEPERMHEWVGGLVEFRKLGPGPQLGSRGVQVVNMAGRRWELESEITRYEPPHELEARLVHKDFESRARYRLEEGDGRTRVTTTMDIQYKQTFARLLAGVVTRQTQRKLEADLARLKQVAERAG